MGSYRSGNRGFGDFILRHRRSIGVLLLLITAFMAWNAARVRAATRFESLFPFGHPNVKLYQQYERRYGGAQTLVLLMRVRHGDVFNYDTLRKIVEVQNAVNGLPAVDHNQVFSLASYRVAFTEAVPGELIPRLVVGVGRILHVGKVQTYDSTRGSDTYPLWDRPITHSIRPGKADGFLLPYHEYLRPTGDAERGTRGFHNHLGNRILKLSWVCARTCS